MFRFTIRDVLWLMVVVGMALGWWTDRTRQIERAENQTDAVLIFVDDFMRDMDVLKPGWRHAKYPKSPDFEVDAQKAKDRQRARGHYYP